MLEKIKNLAIFSVIIVTVLVTYGGLLYVMNTVVPEVQRNIEKMILDEYEVGQR